MTHDELVKLAAKWVRSRRYQVVLEDVRTNCVREQPDVIGWKGRGESIVVECKASIDDYRRDAGKPFRRRSEEGMGRLRWYATTTAHASVVAEDIVHRGPSVGRWGVVAFNPRKQAILILNAQPFLEHEIEEERRLLISCVRRVTEGWGRRMFGDRAPLKPNGDPHPSAHAIIRDLQRENARLRRQLERRTSSSDVDVLPFDASAHDIDA